MGITNQQKKLLQDTIKDLKDISSLLIDNSSSSGQGNGESDEEQQNQNNQDNNSQNSNNQNKDKQNNSQSSNNSQKNNKKDKENSQENSNNSEEQDNNQNNQNSSNKSSSNLDKDFEDLNDALSELEDELNNQDNNSEEQDNNQQGKSNSESLEDSDNDSNEQEDSQANQDSNSDSESQDSKNSNSNSKSSSQNNKSQKSASNSGGMPTEITLGGQKIDISKVNTHDCILDKSSVDKYGEDLKNGKNMIERLNHDLSQRIKNAIDAAKEAGHTSSAKIFELFDKQQAGGAPGWLDILEPYLKYNINNRKPYTAKAYRSRRTQYSDYEIFYPYEQPIKDELKGILFAIDTSGSIDYSRDLPKFIGQIKALMEENKKTVEGGVVYWDDGIASYGKFTNYEELKEVPPSGGGGTNFLPVVDLAKEEKYKILVVYTDGYFADIDRLQNTDLSDFDVIIWVLYDKQDWLHFKAPTGIKCLIDPEEND